MCVAMEMKWPLVLVRWLDSAAPRGWQPLADWKGAGTLDCVSVGYLYAEDEVSKTIIPHFAFPEEDANRQGSGILVIPAGAIVSIERLVGVEASNVPRASERSD
jgi:hypothetical protein